MVMVIPLSGKRRMLLFSGQYLDMYVCSAFFFFLLDLDLLSYLFSFFRFFHRIIQGDYIIIVS